MSQADNKQGNLARPKRQRNGMNTGELTSSARVRESGADRSQASNWHCEQAAHFTANPAHPVLCAIIVQQAIEVAYLQHSAGDFYNYREGK